MVLPMPDWPATDEPPEALLTVSAPPAVQRVTYESDAVVVAPSGHVDSITVRIELDPRGLTLDLLGLRRYLAGFAARVLEHEELAAAVARDVAVACRAPVTVDVSFVLDEGLERTVRAVGGQP